MFHSVKRVFSLVIISFFLFGILGSSDIICTTVNNRFDLESSGPLGYTIYIMNNWSLTRTTYPQWCSGSGTYGDPYVIHDIEIDGNGKNGIEIANTKEYFRIQNVTIYDSGSTTEQGGIKLSSVGNGTITNCTIRNNRHNGFFISNCRNNTIFNNTIYANTDNGVHLQSSSSDNKIMLNNISQNDGCGISIYYSSVRTNISSNLIKNNDDWGIQLYSYCNNSYIYNNTIVNNRVNGQSAGISMSTNCGYSLILNNTIENNIFYGIYASSSCDHTRIINNTIGAHPWFGVVVDSSRNFTFYSNKFKNSGIYLVGTTSSSHTISKNNTVNSRVLYYYVNKNYLNSDNFTNSGQIILINCNHSLISNQNLSYASIGVQLQASRNCSISSVKANNQQYGIYLTRGSVNNSISNCTVNKNFDGITLSTNCNNNTVKNNTIYLNTNNGIYISGGSYYNNISLNNIIFNKQYGIYITSHYNNVSYNLVKDNSVHGILLWGGNYNTILNNTLFNNSNYGIQAYSGSDRNWIIKNYVTKSDYGIGANMGSDHNLIYQNKLTTNDVTGILSLDTYYNYFVENEIQNNLNTGIQFQNVNYSLIYNNTIRNWGSTNQDNGIMFTAKSTFNVISSNVIKYHKLNNNYGIILSACSNNSLYDNLISNNTYNIDLRASSNYNNISRNLITNASLVGVNMNETLCLSNRYNRNMFVSNKIHAKDRPTTTIWDNGTVGNYWDNYTGFDTALDGIGDTPYTIAYNGIDTKPLMVLNFSTLFDYDGDILTDYQEYNGSFNDYNEEPTDPFDLDSDNDLLDDGQEELTYHTNPNDPDSDDDGLDDYVEITTHGTDPNDPDCDDDLLNDYEELITWNTDPEDLDSDDDSLTDYEEVITHNTDPNDPDSDGDSLDDAEELNTYQTDPLLIDSDADNFNDSIEITLDTDPIDRWSFPKSDLIVVEISIYRENLTIQIQNNGIWNASNVSVRILFTEKRTFQPLIHLNGSFALQVDELILFNVSISKIRGLIRGNDYYVNVTVDPFDYSNETVENNNFSDTISFKYAQSDNFPFEIIFVILVAAVALGTSFIVIRARAIRKTKSSITSEAKQEQVPLADSNSKDQVKFEEAQSPESSPSKEGKIAPEKIQNPENKAEMIYKKAKAGEIEPSKELNKKERKELKKTEKEVDVFTRDIICLVHKGKIFGSDIYLCPKCNAFYCKKCAQTLKLNHETCWSCGASIDMDTNKIN